MIEKGSLKHPTEALEATTVRNLRKPGRYADGNGLYLIVDRSGAKRWVLRTVIRGKPCDIGLLTIHEFLQTDQSFGSPQRFCRQV